MESGRATLVALLATLEGQRRPEGLVRESMSDYEAIRIYRYQDMDVCRRVLRRFIDNGAMAEPRVEELSQRALQSNRSMRPRRSACARAIGSARRQPR
jgi:hypothetical protein